MLTLIGNLAGGRILDNETGKIEGGGGTMLAAMTTSAPAAEYPFLRFEHGDNACRACHDPARYDRLRLATGDSVPMTEALRLCAQCHGTQHRDWLHGAHGGMNGYWDLRRGDRVRNHCVDCHDPHAPRFPRFMPMDPPRDTARTSERTHG